MDSPRRPLQAQHGYLTPDKTPGKRQRAPQLPQNEPLTPENTQTKPRAAPVLAQREPLASQTLPRGYVAQPRRPFPLTQQPRRFKKVLRDNIRAAMNKPTIRRLARRGGIRRIQAEIYPTIQDVVKDRIKEILRVITTILELVNRKTVSALDVVYALKRLGTPLYGFGMIEYGELLPDRRAEYQAKLKRNAENRARVARDMEEDQRRDEHEERLRRVDEGVRGMMRGARA